VSDEEQPSETPGPGDSSTSFTPPAAPGDETAAGTPTGGKNRTPLIAAIAIILILAVASGAYFLVFAKDKGPFAFSGEINSQGSCGGDPKGFSAKMLAPNGSVIAQGPFGQHNTSAGCTITFAFELPKADSYQFALGLSPQAQAVAGTDAIPGPTYTLDELKSQDFHVKLGPSDFTPPSPSAPTPAPSGSVPSAGTPSPMPSGVKNSP
jgi:hypothetical protein